MRSHTRSSIHPFIHSFLKPLPSSYRQLLILFSFCPFIIKVILTTHLLQLCVKLIPDKIDENLL